MVRLFQQCAPLLFPMSKTRLDNGSGELVSVTLLPDYIIYDNKLIDDVIVNHDEVSYNSRMDARAIAESARCD